jgi:hypothetical protein
MALSKTLYADFGFKRPKEMVKGSEKQYGIFCIAFYQSLEDRNSIAKTVVRSDLWEDSTYMTAFQAYDFALNEIYSIQSHLLRLGVERVYLRTENGGLIDLILGKASSKRGEAIVEKINAQYCGGAVKEIRIGTGMAQKTDYARAKKYCLDSLVIRDVRECVTRRLAKPSELKLVSLDDILDSTELEDTELLIEGIKEI